MIKSARTSSDTKKEVTKSIIRHKSRQRLFIQKRDSSDNRDLSTSAHKQNITENRGSMIKLKRPPLSNIALLRSQSNLSLYKRDGSQKEIKTMSSMIRSPDLSYKSPKLADLRTEGNYSKHLEQESSCISNRNHLTMGNLLTNMRSHSSLQKCNIEMNSIKNIQNTHKDIRSHNSIPKEQGQKCTNCAKASAVIKVSKKTLIDMAEQFQVFVRELLHKDGQIMIMKDEFERQTKENDELKLKILELEGKLKQKDDSTGRLYSKLICLYFFFSTTKD